jgi:hypothetical protein
MKIFSIYESMQESANLCPVNTNIKMLMRHSVRQDIKEGASVEEMQNAQLTREGKVMAKRFGSSIEMSVNTISSSCNQRCVDTCSELIKGYNKTHRKFNGEIIKTKLLECPHSKGTEDGGTFKRLGIEGIFDGWVNHVDMHGIYDINISSNKLLDYIFGTGNINNTLDIFCMHDFQLAMLLLFFNNNSIEFKQRLFAPDYWPFMLEGMFLYENKTNINWIWRGKLNCIKSGPSVV